MISIQFIDWTGIEHTDKVLNDDVDEHQLFEIELNKLPTDQGTIFFFASTSEYIFFEGFDQIKNTSMPNTKRRAHHWLFNSRPQKWRQTENMENLIKYEI